MAIMLLVVFFVGAQAQDPPYDPHHSFDCAMRPEALAFAYQIQGWVAQTNVLVLASKPSETPKSVSGGDRVPLFKI
jgi:hypothetical protein